ncbi:MAG: hypothetical protein LC649_07420 [Bacteroidales bacterium]|nr:hypothetical protein [Bacteroidales bacterium]
MKLSISLMLLICINYPASPNKVISGASPSKDSLDITISKFRLTMDETLFTTYAWIRYAGYLENEKMPDSEPVNMVLAYLDSSMTESQRNDMITLYKGYKAKFDFMFEYIASVFAVNSTPPPVIKCRIDELKQYRNGGDSTDLWSIKRMKEIESLGPVLSRFYQEQNIGLLFSKCIPHYRENGERYMQLAAAQIREAILFTRTPAKELERITEIRLTPNLLENANTEMGFEYMGIKYDIKGSGKDPRYHPHEFTHSLVAPVTRNPEFEQKIIKIVDKVWEEAENSPARKSYKDKISYFDENLVRVISNMVYYKPDTEEGSVKYNRVRLMEIDNGWLLYEALEKAVSQYRESDLSFTAYFDTFLGNM